MLVSFFDDKVHYFSTLKSEIMGLEIIMLDL
jgi:hypothetical protein